MAVRDDRGDVKQTTTGFRDPRHHICRKQIPIPPFLPFEIAPIPQRQPLRNAKRFRSSLQQTITNIAKILGQARY